MKTRILAVICPVVAVVAALLINATPALAQIPSSAGVCSGPKGDAGAAGPQGPAGDKGDKGDKGDAGADAPGVTAEGGFGGGQINDAMANDRP